MLYPEPLKRGDRVAIVSPAGPVTAELLESGIETLKSWGLEPVVDEAVYERTDRGYLAGSDQTRLAAVQGALDDPEIRGVVFSRGGYGTMRILPDLDFGGLRASPKLLVGFSDLTALHLYLSGCHDIATMHGPVVKSFRLHGGDDDASLENLRAALFGERVAPFAVDDLSTVRPGRTRGRILGGNLTLIAKTLASPFCPDLSDTILLVEDVGEEDYRLDRLFTSLRLAEKARDLAGLVVGDFTDCGGTYVDDDVISEFVADLAAEFDCPVVAGFPSGHGSPNFPVPMGVDAELDADAGRLEFLTDAVKTTVTETTKGEA